MQAPPEDAVCIEDGCTQDPTATRPLSGPVLTWLGVTDEGVEWVCATHATTSEGISS